MGSIPIARAIYAIGPVEKAGRYERSDEGSIPSSRAIHMCVYRSGHNDLDLKSSVPTLIRLVGSNPTAHAKPKRAA